MMRALIVDDEQLAVERMETILSAVGDIDICRTSLNPWDAYEYAKTNRIDIAFLDISMPEINGIRLSSLLLDLHPSLDVVFVTGYDNYAVQAFDMGAQDYLIKPVTTERMSKTLDRIRTRHRHETVRPSDSYSALPAEEHSEQVMLTEQETRVVRLITDGFSNKEMADHLNITTETVKFHLKNVYRKLNVNNRVQVLQHLMELKKRI
ncbi:response regulator transcription factor [Paenibacillus filicis]|uniref:Response regulator transcription factor n=1 Tax=Paenibacillus gyeongsangnamensis TaxID=3388067 RepID=A0ABT4QJV6_9BACL|nr:response regulator transcription factor [Paenibacillus filicis]MCZ8517158.1 response regulator transcription factor [Paenibacillus filicis]